MSQPPTPDNQPHDAGSDMPPPADDHAGPAGSSASAGSNASANPNANTGAKPTAEGDHNWPMFCHLAALSGAIGLPAGNILGPLIVWQMKKKEDPEVDYHGAEALNFNISYMIYTLGLIVTIIGIIALPLLAIAYIYYFIMGTMAAAKGERYVFPYIFRFVKTEQSPYV